MWARTYTEITYVPPYLSVMHPHRTSDLYVRVAYDQIMSHLVKEHAEIRLSAFQLANELFPRSHVFRELLISDFQKFVQLVTETDPLHPLPLPKPVARQLKEKSLLAIREWNERFGEGYPKLRLGFNYLKHNKKVCRACGQASI